MLVLAKALPVAAWLIAGNSVVPLVGMLSRRAFAAPLKVLCPIVATVHSEWP